MRTKTDRAETRSETPGQTERRHSMSYERMMRLRGGGTRFLTVLMTMALWGGLTACEDILDVDLPGNVTEDDLNDPSLSEILVNSVIADFECAYNNYTFGSSAHSDEMWQSSGNLTERNWGQRKITADFDNYVSGTCGGGGYGLWTTMHTARFQADDIFDRISGFDDVADKESMLATVRTYGGFMYTYLAEGFCQVSIDGRDPISPAQVLAMAEDRFESAMDLAESSGNAEMLNAARVGLARVRRNHGDYDGARDLAELVPDGFVLNATRSDDFPRRYNKGRWAFDQQGHHTVAPGFRDLEWKGTPDPRVEVVDAGRTGLDGVTELFLSTKWPSRSTPIPIASWKEAQLIVAEAAAATGDDPDAVTIINDLHILAGLPGYDPLTDGPLMDHIIQERSRELFQEGGNRLNDMLRFDLPFFEGVDHVGGLYGNTTCFPYPVVEGG